MKNKIIAIISILLVLFGLFYLLSLKEVSAPTPTPEPVAQNPEPQVNIPEGWQTYSNFGLEISYPPTWSAQERSEYVVEDRIFGGEAPKEFKISGDGYSFIVNPDFGTEFDPSQYEDINIKVTGQDLIGKKKITPIAGNNFFFFTLDRTDSNNFYFFRINTDINLETEVASMTVQKVLNTVKFIPR